MKRTVYSPIFQVTAKDVPVNDIKEGVYIEDINGGLWKPRFWCDMVKPNAILVINYKHSFRIALDDAPTEMRIHTYENYPSACNLAQSSVWEKPDFDGVENTQRILSVQPLKSCAAGYCSSFIFPDGVTHGYLPAEGEFRLAYKEKKRINDALEACGGSVMSNRSCYWTSTFWGCVPHGKSHANHLFRWDNGEMIIEKNIDIHFNVRPFAEL